MRLRHRVTAFLAAVAALFTVATSPSVAGELPQGGPAGSSASSGSHGSLGSGASAAGSSGIPSLGALFPLVNPYSENTVDNLVAFGDSFTANSH